MKVKPFDIKNVLKSKSPTSNSKVISNLNIIASKQSNLISKYIPLFSS